jgi:hypothetical protein
MKQCRQDGLLLRQGRVRGAHWHFAPYLKNTLGPTEELLQCLMDEGIPFTIYPPED